MGGTVRNMTTIKIGAPFRSVTAAVALATLLSGCSSDVSRFDFPAFGLTQQNPRARPTPSAPIYDGGAPEAAPGYAPTSAPPPDYGNYGSYSDNGQFAPNPAYRGPGAPYAAPAYAQPSFGPSAYGQAPYAQPNYGQPNYGAAAAPGFGTVPGQPESYHPERFASNGQTAYITNPNPTAGPAASYSPAPLLAPLGGSPAILPPIAPSQVGLVAHRPKSGALVEVLPGETLYQFSRRNGVSISAVMQANNMRSPIVHAGEKLIIPGKGGRSILPPIASTTPLAPAPAAPATVVFEPSEGDNPDGTYTVRAGDSVYGIARKHNVRPEDIMALNGIGDITKVKFGQVLKMPGAAGPLRPLASARAISKPGPRIAALQPSPGNEPPAATMTDADADGIPDGTVTDGEADASNPMAPAAAPTAKPKMTTLAPVKPVMRSGPKDPASAPIVASITPAAATGSEAGSDSSTAIPSDGRFRWPVRGRIIGKFGPAGKAGQQNEGIDLAVPMGTEIHAAENGVVAYAGDELKGYGKLILIRHADNWVTAYAHNDELLVKRGDQIRRGQVIAKAGKSGGIDQPLLHFELRKGSQPVDPMPHMAAN